MWPVGPGSVTVCTQHSPTVPRPWLIPHCWAKMSAPRCVQADRSRCSADRVNGARGLTGHPQTSVCATFGCLSTALARHKLDYLRGLVEQGKITLRVADVYPAADAPAAHRRLEAGGVRGRLVLDIWAPQETQERGQ